VVPVSCPLGSTAEYNPVYITGFNVEPTAGGARISWIATGAEAKTFRVLLRNSDGATQVVAQGQADTNRLSRVTVAGGKADATYLLEVVDRTGWTTRVGTDGKTERFAVAPAPTPVRTTASAFDATVL
jgi:hypothetical protein